MPRPMLFERFASLRAACPWIELADSVPTPLQHLVDLGAMWNLPALYVKREDLTSSVYGGNKVRKLEWILGDVLARGRTSVLTTGAWGSHHAFATALYAGRVGVRCSVVLMPQPPTQHVAQMFGATAATATRVVRAHSVATVPLALARARAAALVAGDGWPYSVPPGGSNARGALGYVDFALELAHQIEAGEMPAPDYVHVAAGTCGTAAGISVGLAIAAQRVPALARIEIMATRVVPSIVANKRRMRALQRGVAQLLWRAGANLPAEHRWIPIRLIDDQIGAGYGHATAAGLEAAADAHVAAALAVEPTYTAKALAGLRVFAASDEALRNAVHLYVHTAALTPPVDTTDRVVLPEALQLDWSPR